MNRLRVIEFEGLAPSVFCGLYFADVDAEVIFVARAESASFSMPFANNILNRNKQCIQVNFKDPHQLSQLKELIKTSDIVIDPFRPGVLEKLKLGPKDLYELNKRIILLRVSGYGQTGTNKLRPGHDLNYIGTSGILPLINSEDCQFPSNYLADFVSASLGITGVLGALTVRERSGEGGVVDCSLTDGCTYLAQNILNSSPTLQEEIIKTFKIGQK
jgi:alpha-methylacyl-CoA racemase